MLNKHIWNVLILLLFDQAKSRYNKNKKNYPPLPSVTKNVFIPPLPRGESHKGSVLGHGGWFRVKGVGGVKPLSDFSLFFSLDGKDPSRPGRDHYAKRKNSLDKTSLRQFFFFNAAFHFFLFACF
jgi:hypothetical protein